MAASSSLTRFVAIRTGETEARPADRVLLAGFVLVACAVAVPIVDAAALVSLTRHRELADWGIFIVAFFVLLPAAVALGWLLLLRLPSDGPQVPLAAVCVAGLLGALWLSRALEWTGHAGDAPEVVLLAGATATGAALIVLLLRPGGLIHLVERVPSQLSRVPWALAIPLSFVPIVLLFVPDQHRTLGNVLGASLVGLAVGGICLRRYAWRPPAPWVVVVDLLAALLILFAALDLGQYAPTPVEVLGLLGDPANGANTARQFHSDPFLAPTNDVLHGRTLFVDTGTLYGIGSIYFLAGIFKVVPLGYGGFGLLTTFLVGLQQLLAYLCLRVAGVGPLLAGAVVGVSLAVLSWASTPVYGPSLAALRFGLPFLFLLLILWRGRGGEAGSGLPYSSLMVLGLSAVWSVETFAYTAAAFTAAAVVRAAAGGQSPREASAILMRNLIRGGFACAVAFALLTAATVLRAGEAPDFAWYLATIRGLSGDLTSVLVGGWSPVWALGACYLLTLAGVAWIGLARPAFIRQQEQLMTALAVTATIGVSFLTYHVNRSVDQVLPTLCLPALMLVALWVHAVLREPHVRRSLKAATAGTAAWLLAFVVFAAWPLVQETWPRSALSHVAPGGASLRRDLSALWESPRIDPRSATLERLIKGYFPGESSPLVLAEPDLTTEALIRTGRANRLPVSFVNAKGTQDHWSPMLREATREVRAGDYAIVQRHSEQEPPSGPLVAAHAFGHVEEGRWLNQAQRAALQQLRARFRLRTVKKGAHGLLVVVLRTGLPGGTQ